jgi:hypothetical protein
VAAAVRFLRLHKQKGCRGPSRIGGRGGRHGRSAGQSVNHFAPGTIVGLYRFRQTTRPVLPARQLLLHQPGEAGAHQYDRDRVVPDGGTEGAQELFAAAPAHVVHGLIEPLARGQVRRRRPRKDPAAQRLERMDQTNRPCSRRAAKCLLSRRGCPRRSDDAGCNSRDPMCSAAAVDEDPSGERRRARNVIWITARSKSARSHQLR